MPKLKGAKARTRHSKKAKMRIGDVVVDPVMSARARGKLDPFHVARLRDHYRGGSTFEPLVVNADDKTLTDGFHRREVYLKEGGEGIKVAVILVTYEDKIDQMLHAGEINSRHGKPLDSQDVAEFIVKLSNYGVSMDTIGESLSLTTEKIDRVVIRRTGTLSDGARYALKPAFRAYAAGRIPKKIRIANERMGGRNQEVLLQHLISILQVGALEEDNQTVMRRTEALYRLVRKKYAEPLGW